MRLLKPFTAILVLLAVLAPTALAAGASAKPSPAKAKKAKGTRVDPSFGSHGVVQVATKSPEAGVKMAVAPNGRTYVLQGSQLLAFKSSGKPATGFGTDGSVSIAADKGESVVSGLALDSQGRILVDGTIYLGRQNQAIGLSPELNERIESREAFVIRLLANGSRDGTFGTDGEVDTNFDLPRTRIAPYLPFGNAEYETPVLKAISIAVDSQDRPIVGGAYREFFPCTGTNSSVSYAARLTVAGAVDTTFAGEGYLLGGGTETTGIEPSPGGGMVLSSHHDSSGECIPRASRFDELTVLTEGGETIWNSAPGNWTLKFEGGISIDPSGRIVSVDGYSELFPEEPGVLTRLLPDGAVDASFAHDGGYPLKGRIDDIGAVAIDAKGRPIVAGGENRIQLMRFTAAGKADSRFAPKGTFSRHLSDEATGTVEALAVDAQGRIYVAGKFSGGGGKGIRIVRVLPAS